MTSMKRPAVFLMVLLIGLPLVAQESTAPKGEQSGKPEPGRTDLFGDPLPPGALVRMGTVRFARGDTTQHGAVFAPDKKTFVTVSNYTPHGPGRVVCVWDAVTGQEIRPLIDPDYEHFQAVFLKSEDRLATIGHLRKPAPGNPRNYVFQLWDLKTGKKTGQPIAVTGYHFEPWALSPNEEWIASAGREPPVIVRERTTGRSVAEWPGEGKRVNQLLFSPDGGQLAIGCEDTLRFWDWRNNRVTHQLNQKDITGLWFSPDGKLLAAVIHGEGVRVWDVATLKVVNRFKDPERNHGLVPGASYPHNVRFFPDSKRLVSLVTGVIWDAESGKQVGELEAFAVCANLKFSADGKSMTAFSPGRLRRWDAATGKAVGPPQQNAPVRQIMIHQLGFLPDGKTVVSGSPDGAVRQWDAATGNELGVLAPGDVWDHKRVSFMRVAADGTVVAVRNKRMTLFKDGRPPQEIALTEFPGENLSSVNVSNNGKYLVLAGSGEKEHLIQVWSLAERKRTASFAPSESTRLEALGISDDGRHIVACDLEFLFLLDCRTGKLARNLIAPIRMDDPPMPGTRGGGRDRGYMHFHGVNALSFSPEQTLVVTYGHPFGQFKLIDAFTGITRHAFRPGGQASYALHNAIFSPDGKMLAAESDDGVVDIWETESGVRRHRFRGHRSYQTAFAFSPDSAKLASGNRDATILVWDIFGLYGNPPAPPATPLEMTAAWAEMLDAERAALAMGRIMRSGDLGVRFLKEQVRPSTIDPEQIKKWIGELDSAAFQRRENAARELDKHLRSASLLLKDALADNPSLELRQRVKRLLEKLETLAFSAAQLRELRALEVLEHIGTKAADDVLRGIVAGDHDLWLADAAKAARKRLGLSADQKETRLKAADYPNVVRRVKDLEERANSVHVEERVWLAADVRYTWRGSDDGETVRLLRHIAKHDANPTVRGAAIRHLYYHWAPIEPSELPEVFSGYSGKLLDRRQKSLTKHLIEDLKQGDAEAGYAAYALGLLRCQEAAPALRGLANDKNAFARYSAARALMSCGDKEGAAPILKSLMNAGVPPGAETGQLVDPYYQARAARAYAELGAAERTVGTARLVQLMKEIAGWKNLNADGRLDSTRVLLAQLSGQYFESHQQAQAWYEKAAAGK
jgi:WD40 repeat protein